MVSSTTKIYVEDNRTDSEENQTVVLKVHWVIFQNLGEEDIENNKRQIDKETKSFF